MVYHWHAKVSVFARIWQVRLADAVFESDKPCVIDLLCQMLKFPEVEVALAAAESLEAKDYVWTPGASLREILEKPLDAVEEEKQHAVKALYLKVQKGLAL